MKGKLDWQSEQVVNIYDEVSLWSAPFVRMMLENIPMSKGDAVLDVGFGTGVPLIELAQRFGDTSTIYGIDLWKAAIDRTREKIRVFGIDNITIFEQSAETIPLQDQSINLICSNLGVNNFENKDVVIKECHRVLKSDGHLCITTNPIGTFKELFEVFKQAMHSLELNASLLKLSDYIEHRGTKDSIESEFTAHGFAMKRIVRNETHMRFVNASALFDHGLMCIGFLHGWEKLIASDQQQDFFSLVIELIEATIAQNGVFNISIPMLYMEFQREN